jgi:thermitase
LRIRSLSLALLAVALVVPEGAAAADSERIIVQHEPGAERDDVRDDAGVRLVERLPLPRTELVAPRDGDVDEALRELNSDRDVVYAEVDRPVQALSDDPYFGELWGLQAMDVPDGWTMSSGAGAPVAVIDTGVNGSHPDLLGKVQDGYDWVGNDNNADDHHGHGSHVAGTIAAIRGNGAGIAGVAPAVAVLPLRVLGADGTGSTSDIVSAFDYAGDQGVRVVNASFGSDDPSTSERKAIEAHPDTLFVVAAGNSGTSNDGAVREYPCSYSLANILCVGGSTQSDQRASFSNYGATTVDVFAPGSRILSTWLGTGYRYSDGTSMAAPHVAGTAALVLEADPSKTTAQVKAAIMDSVDPVPALSGLSVTGGRVNAARALGWVPPPDNDGDGVGNTSDNCPDAANSGQGDADGDAAGDACDPTPRGPDADGDGKPSLDDGCPSQPAATANGCPAAPPPVVQPPAAAEPVPSFTSLTAKPRRRTVTVTIRTDRAAMVGLTLERKRCKKKCRWVRVTGRIVSANDGSATVKLKQLKRGAHRARVTLSSRAGTSRPRTVRFRIR